MSVGKPIARIAANTAFVFVKRLFAYARAGIPRRILSRTKAGNGTGCVTACSLMAFLLAPLFAGDLVAAFAEGVETHEKRGPQGRHEGHRGERALGHLGVRPFLDVRGEGEGIEGNVGEVEPARAARLFLAVDRVDVLAGVLVDAGLRFLEEVGTLAELQGARRTSLGARRREAFRLAFGAEGAFLDVGHGLRVLVLWNTEGAGNHAVAAA